MEESIPSFTTSEERTILASQFSFWHLLDRHVKNNGALDHVVSIRSGAQVFYSKIKGGVDGATQYRAIMRNPSASQAWEPKIAIQTLKTIAVNGALLWRFLKRKSRLDSMDKFESPDSFRASLNRVESLPDFIDDVARELIVYGQILDMIPGAALANSNENGTTEEESSNVPDIHLIEIEQLKTRVPGWHKRRRIDEFKQGDGKRLRLSATKFHRAVKLDKKRYCVICADASAYDKNIVGSWRGHQTQNGCQTCKVTLCHKAYPPFKYSCFDYWHNARDLKARQASPVNRNA